MQESLRIRATVQPGSRIEIVDRHLQVGEEVDVVVSPAATGKRRSAVDILKEAPGHLVFKTAEEVAAYLKEEKESWGR
ncbi:MAG: hypothetical protein OXL97_14315 [Chloroflexota bacterium]|nr:hypothetical protein [Chloroflexota bacterium]MDE2885938.1 hypothetical protein [Chloroflexota bacterium]